MIQHLLGTDSDSYITQCPIAHTNYSILSACSVVRAALGSLKTDRMSEPRLRNECRPSISVMTEALRFCPTRETRSLFQ